MNGIDLNLKSNHNNNLTITSNYDKIFDINKKEDITFFKQKNIIDEDNLIECNSNYNTINETKINYTNFGNISNIKISNNGHLLNNIILNIEIPKCQLIYKNKNEINIIIKKNIEINKINLSYIDYILNYNNLNNILSYNIKLLDNISNLNNILSYKKDIKYKMINIYSKNNLNYILQIYINYIIKNYDISYKTIITDIYYVYNIIKNEIITQVCSNVNINEYIYDIKNELLFIYDIYNSPSNNIMNFVSSDNTLKYSNLFFLNIKISITNYNQSLLFIYDSNNATKSQQSNLFNEGIYNIKNVVIITNIINNTLQITNYISNYNILIDNYKNILNQINYYCGTSSTQSLYNIKKLYQITNFNLNLNSNKYEITIIVKNNDILDFEILFVINKLLFIYDSNNYISNAQNTFNYKIPIIIGKITKINKEILLNSISYIITINSIENTLNNININDYVYIDKSTFFNNNNLDNNNIYYDQILDIKKQIINFDTYNQYVYILNILSKLNYTNDKIRSIIHIYTNYIYVSNNINITNIIQYDNLNNVIEHNIKYLKNIYKNIHTNNLENLNGRIICMKSNYTIINGIYNMTATNILNIELKNYFINKYLIKIPNISNLNYYKNGVDNYYNLYQSYIINNIDILINYISTSFDNILKICRLGIINTTTIANILSNVVIDKYIFQLNTSSNNILINDICIIYDNINNTIYKDDNNNIIKFLVLNIENNYILVYPVDFLNLNELHNEMYLFKYDININYHLFINSNYKIINYITCVDNIDILTTNLNISKNFLKSVYFNSTLENNQNNKLYDFNDLLLHFILYTSKYIITSESTILLDINQTIYNSNYFLQYSKNKLLELYHYIYFHNMNIRSHYISLDNTIGPIINSNVYNLIFCLDLNNIYCPKQIINYIINLINEYLLKYIILDIVIELTNKEIYIYNKNTNNIELYTLINDDQNLIYNVLNLQYLLQIKDYDKIMIYYYSYQANLNNLNDLENNLKKIYKNGFSYQLFLNLVNYDNNNIYNIYCNLIKTIIELLKFKNITDDFENIIILSYDIIITNYLIINPSTLNDKKILYYYNKYIYNLYNKYEFHDIIDILNDINKKYYDIISILLNGYNIGMTTGKISYIINSNTNFNLNDIINNELIKDNRLNLIKNNINNSKFIYDKKLYKLEAIEQLIDIIIEQEKTQIEKFIINRNLLNINNIIFDNTINKLDLISFQSFILKNLFDINNFYNKQYQSNIIINNNLNYILSSNLQTKIIEIFNNYNYNSQQINNNMKLNTNYNISSLITNIISNITNITDKYLSYYTINYSINYNINQFENNLFILLSNLNNIININNISYHILINYFKNNNIIQYDKNIEILILHMYLEFDDFNIFINDINIKDIIKNQLLSSIQDIIINYIKNYASQQLLINILSDKNSIYLKKYIPEHILILYASKIDTISIQKYWLYIPNNENKFENNIILLPIIYDKYVIIKTNYTKYINNKYQFNNVYNNKLYPEITYTLDEMNIKKENYNNYISLYEKINDIIQYNELISQNEINIQINLQIAEKIIIKLLLNKLINNDNNNIINDNITYNNILYSINGNINDIIIINEIKYKIINYTLINILENINDVEKFIYNNNIIERINIIKYYKYNYNTKFFNLNYFNDDILIKFNHILEKLLINFENTLIFDTSLLDNNNMTIFDYINNEILINKLEFSQVIFQYKNKLQNKNSIIQYCYHKNNFSILNNYYIYNQPILTFENYIDYLINDNSIIYNIFNSNDDIINNNINIFNILNELKIKINYAINNNINDYNKKNQILNDIKNIIINRDNNPIPIFKWIYNLGNFIFDYIDINIGGQIYDTITCDWYYIYNQIFNSKYNMQSIYSNNEFNCGYNKLIGNIKQLIEYSSQKDSYSIYLTIPTFFLNGYLPVIAMNGNELYINIKYKKLDDLIIKKNNLEETILLINQKIKCQPIVNYINVSDEEKKFLIYSKHTFLIQKMQYKEHITSSRSQSVSTIFSKEKTCNIQIQLNLKNCVKDLFWIYQTKNAILNKQYYNYSNVLYNYMMSDDINEILNDLYNIDMNNYLYVKKVILNSINNKYKNTSIISNIDQIFDIKNLLQSIDLKIIRQKYINSIDKLNNDIINSSFKFSTDSRFKLDNIESNYIIPYKYYPRSLFGVNIYNFNLFPNITQPSGSINLSKFDDQILEINLNYNEKNDGIIKIFARSYNVMKIMSNLSGLMY